jgi:hypothetical protein
MRNGFHLQNIGLSYHRSVTFKEVRLCLAASSQGDRAQFCLDGSLSPAGAHYERLAETLAGLHVVAFAILMAH